MAWTVSCIVMLVWWKPPIQPSPVDVGMLA
jgi:hypothetical protein